jgi:hypothetical protein
LESQLFACCLKRQVAAGKRQADVASSGKIVAQYRIGLYFVLMTAQQLLADIHVLEQELIGFERKYGIRSETFYAAYQSGEEPENDEWTLDFGEWASVYRTWLTRQAEYRNEIQRIQHDKPSLAGLIHVAA